MLLLHRLTAARRLFGQLRLLLLLLQVQLLRILLLQLPMCTIDATLALNIVFEWGGCLLLQLLEPMLLLPLLVLEL